MERRKEKAKVMMDGGRRKLVGDGRIQEAPRDVVRIEAEKELR
jgi:hypothetical protein